MTKLAPEDLGTILGVWAHPDDETFGMAGIMARAVANGQRVVCITATRGEQGSKEIAPEELGPMREIELDKALALLGVTEHIWLGYPDGGCADVSSPEVVQRLAAIIADIKPDTVMGFGPDGGTFHPDHIATYHWTRAAIAASGLQPLHLCNANTREGVAKILEFVPIEMIMMTDDEPVYYEQADLDLFFELDPETLELKMQALEAQVTQTKDFIALVGRETFKSNMQEETYVIAR